MIPNICTILPVNNGFNKSYDYNLIIYHVITTDHNISYDYKGQNSSYSTSRYNLSQDDS